MKRLISIIVTGALTFLLLLPNPSSAVEVKGGLKIGASLTNFYGDDVGLLEEAGVDLTSRIGVSVGGFITINIAEVFAIQPEVQYITKGSKWKGEVFGFTGKIWINATYLEIPVLAKITIPTQGSVKPSLFAGPAIALKLSGKYKEEFDGDTYEEDLDELKGTDFGLVIGGGLDFGLGAPGTGSVSVDIRYSLGLSKVFDIDGEDLEIKNGAFSLMIGYSF